MEASIVMGVPKNMDVFFNGKIPKMIWGYPHDSGNHHMNKLHPLDGNGLACARVAPFRTRATVP